jgi:hypothetical protein
MRGWPILLSGILVLGAGAAPAANVGVGVFGGGSFPIVQDDNGPGAMLGVRVPVNVVPFLTLEPYFSRSMQGDVEETFGGATYTRSGFDVTAFGANVALGSLGLMSGFSFYPYAGIASYKLTRDGSDDVSEVGYNFGLGFGISPTPLFAINVRGELDLIATGDTSRKFGTATVGVTYKFFPLP